MAYICSRARKQFETEVSHLLDTVREAHSRQCSSTAVREFALCSAVLLCSAKLESYIEDLLADWGNSVNAKGVMTDRLPRSTRAFFLTQTALTAAYRKYLVDDDEGALLSKLETLIAQNHFEVAIDSRPMPRFAIGAIIAGRKYPSPKNLRRLFNRFGVPDVFQILNRIAKRDAEALLTSFNDLRNEMAHVGMPVGLSAGDIKQRIRDMKVVVGCIDRVFYSRVCRYVDPSCWVP
jgi:hypothetical protein